MFKFGSASGKAHTGSGDNKMVKNRKDLTPRRSLRGNLSRNKATGTGANIKVVVRIRPRNDREFGDQAKTVIKVVDTSLLIFDPIEDSIPFFYHGVQQKTRDIGKPKNKNKKHFFDHVFSHEANNEEVFENSTKNLIETVMDGCNCSVFVYGATGAGKTFTMLGCNSSPGIMFLTMRELFKRKEELVAERDFELAVSYLEVYNENVQDLLKPGGPALHLREDNKLGVMVAGITLQRIENPEDLFELLEKGNRSRTQHPTDANAESSRSHAVFQVYLRMNIKSSGQTRLAKLSMIDLAGSERAAATGCKGARFTEGANINKSLLALGNCINSLADGQRHVPYRDSKLTRLLKDSLGGNCRTVMIANVSPSSLSYEDTFNTLKYATRAKDIKANVRKNVVNSDMHVSQYIKLVDELNKEIVRLKTAAASGKTDEECSKCKGLEIKPAQPSQDSGISSNTTTSDQMLQSLFEKRHEDWERFHRLQLNRRVLEARVVLKEETNTRISGFCMDTPDKEREHSKLTQTMGRLKKQAVAMKCDLAPLEARIEETEREISELVADSPHLAAKAELEQAKLDCIAADMKLQQFQCINRLKEKELHTRGGLIEDMIGLIKPWYMLIRETGHATNAMTTDYQNLLIRLQGACSVTFEDGDSGLSSSSSTTSTKSSLASTSTSGDDETRAIKRKLPEELDTTFTLTSRNVYADRLLAKAYQPSPAKRAACLKSSPRTLKSSPRTLNKENRASARKAIGTIKGVGTMGTASRFPASTLLSKNRKPIMSSDRPQLHRKRKAFKGRK